MKEKFNWSWNKKKRSTVYIKQLGSLLWVEFPSYKVSPTDGEIRVRRRVNILITDKSVEHKIFEVKNNKSNILIYCNSRQYCEEIMKMVHDIDNKFFNF